jgi:hypothetical protein
MAGIISKWTAAIFNKNLAADIITGLQNGCRCKRIGNQLTDRTKY